MKRASHRGFTLLETLIAITIIGSISILIAQVFFTTARVNTKTEVVKDVKQNGQFALDTISRTIRNAAKIADTCSSTGTALSSLAVENPDGVTTTYGCLYDSSQGVTRIASTSAYNNHSEFLTSQNLTLGGTSCADALMSLSFTCTSVPDEPTFVSVEYTLSQKGSPIDQTQKASEKFATSVTLRN